MSRLDDNGVYVLMGESPTGQPVPLKVDPVTGAVMTSVSVTSLPVGSTKESIFDDNGVPGNAGENPSGRPQVLSISPQGAIYCEMTI